MLQLARDPLAVVDGDEALGPAVAPAGRVDRDAQQPARRALDLDELVAEPATVVSMTACWVMQTVSVFRDEPEVQSLSLPTKVDQPKKMGRKNPPT